MWNRVFRPLMWRMYADMSQMELLVAASGFDWTIVRPPQLVDGPLTGKLIVSADALPEGKHKITRADLAAFLLEEVKSEQYLHQWPMLAS
jgi:putative NADH-flavin reductase